jgi:hypothetical protein
MAVRGTCARNCGANQAAWTVVAEKSRCKAARSVIVLG